MKILRKTSSRLPCIAEQETSLFSKGYGKETGSIYNESSMSLRRCLTGNPFKVSVALFLHYSRYRTRSRKGQALFEE